MIDLAPYRRVLSTPGFTGLFLVGQVLKLPALAVPVILTLHVAVRLDRGFGQAGIVLAVWTIGLAVGALVLGRMMDRLGPRVVFGLSLVAQTLFWGTATVLPFEALAVAVFFGGALLVPGGTVTRVMVSAMVAESERHTGFTLDSMLTNLCALAGPAAAVLVATRLGTVPAMIGVGVLIGVSCVLFLVRNPELHPPGPSGWSTVVASLRKPGLLMAFLCVAATGAMLSGSDLALMATLESANQLPWAAVVMAVCVASAFTGGLLYGSRERALSPALLVIGLGLCTIPIGFVADWRWMVFAFIPSAFLVAPAFSASAMVVGKLSDPGARATIMSIYGTAMMIGSALGAPLAGATFSAGTGLTAFAAVGAVGVLAGLAGWRALRVREAVTK